MPARARLVISDLAISGFTALILAQRSWRSDLVALALMA